MNTHQEAKRECDRQAHEMSALIDLVLRRYREEEKKRGQEVTVNAVVGALVSFTGMLISCTPDDLQEGFLQSAQEGLKEVLIMQKLHSGSRVMN